MTGITAFFMGNGQSGGGGGGAPYMSPNSFYATGATGTITSGIITAVVSPPGPYEYHWFFSGDPGTSMVLANGQSTQRFRATTVIPLEPKGVYIGCTISQAGVTIATISGSGQFVRTG